MIRAIYFDVGETIICETRMWARWADYLGVPKSEFDAVLENTIACDRHHHEALRHFAPELDIAKAKVSMRTLGNEYRIEKGDLYPDAISCLAELRRSGLVVGIAGNQPAETEVDLRNLELPVDHIATSTGVGVAKPDLAFFEALRDLAGLPVDEIAYVGDRLDNDVLPAQAAGMVGVLIERGPWGRVHAMRPEARQANLLVHSLETLPKALREIGAL